jgi:exodeoxyribonuclease VII large subunit
VTPSGEPPDWVLPSWDAVDRPAARSDGAAASAPGTVALRIYGVSEVTRAVRDALRADERLRDVWVEGEVGRVTVSTAGHGYFTLKDERSQLSCVWFRDDRLASPFEPRTGLRVVAHGRIDVFDQQGVYQLYVTALQPAGFGDLALRYEALKARLANEGLFDAARKRPLPGRPGMIAVVTSPSGAVWHDIRTVLDRRWPLSGVLFAPCRVQGDEASVSIVGALGRLGRWIERCRAEGRPEAAPEVTILARGGGSLEDLWPFNDERVVRAIVAHPVPVVSGVGHEVDVTLADFAADVRAPTPSAAAELVTPDRREVATAVDAALAALGAATAERLGRLGRDLGEERRALDRLSPDAQLAAARERAGLLLDRATRVIGLRVRDSGAALERVRERAGPLALGRIARDEERLRRAAGPLPALAAARMAGERSALATVGASLAALAPEATLRRGYAIVRRGSDGRIVRSPAEAPPGERLLLRLAHGRLAATSEGSAGEDDPGA